MADPPLILVVDDEQSYRDALSVALQREGFLVETAADGTEAIARFDSTSLPFTTYRCFAECFGWQPKMVIVGVSVGSAIHVSSSSTISVSVTS